MIHDVLTQVEHSKVEQCWLLLDTMIILSQASYVQETARDISLLVALTLIRALVGSGTGLMKMTVMKTIKKVKRCSYLSQCRFPMTYFDALRILDQFTRRWEILWTLILGVLPLFLRYSRVRVWDIQSCSHSCQTSKLEFFVKIVYSFWLKTM